LPSKTPHQHSAALGVIGFSLTPPSSGQNRSASVIVVVLPAPLGQPRKAAHPAAVKRYIAHGWWLYPDIGKFSGDAPQGFKISPRAFCIRECALCSDVVVRRGGR